MATSIIKSANTWKYLGSKEKGSWLSLPSGWQEIIAISTNSDNRPNLEWNVPYNYTASGQMAISNGYYANSGYYGYGVLSVKSTEVMLQELTHAENTPNNAKIYVYYR